MSETEKILDSLEKGELRAAQNIDGTWQSNTQVKEAILESFRQGKLVESDGFVDKGNLLPQKFDLARAVRLVPRGSAVRRGSFIAPGVVIMPPTYVNVGAYVDEGTMLDSHVLVGSCAQIGKRVHLSAAVQIGGVLEPVGQRPVVIEDDVFIGAGSVIVEGILVRKGAVIAPGVTLSKGVPLFDCVNEIEIKNIDEIPANAVVVPGSRPVNPRLAWARERNLQMNCALIVKYRDEKSNTSLTLEEALR